jgi:hypothetical protein
LLASDDIGQSSTPRTIVGTAIKAESHDGGKRQRHRAPGGAEAGQDMGALQLGNMCVSGASTTSANQKPLKLTLVATAMLPMTNNSGMKQQWHEAERIEREDGVITKPDVTFPGENQSQPRQGQRHEEETELTGLAFEIGDAVENAAVNMGLLSAVAAIMARKLRVAIGAAMIGDAGFGVTDAACQIERCRHKASIGQPTEGFYTAACLCSACCRYCCCKSWPGAIVAIAMGQRGG